MNLKYQLLIVKHFEKQQFLNIWFTLFGGIVEWGERKTIYIIILFIYVLNTMLQM